jgi:hypothetical protein
MKAFLFSVAVIAGVMLFFYGIKVFVTSIEVAEIQRSNFIQDQRQNGPDAVACRASHGFPVFSNWDGYSVTSCNPLPR